MSLAVSLRSCLAVLSQKRHNSTTARQQDSKTARQQDSKTARQQDSKTARLHDCTTARLQSGKNEVKIEIAKEKENVYLTLLVRP
jgi:hypothetical protein